MPASHKPFIQGFVGRARSFRDSIGLTLAEGMRSHLPEDGQSAWINPIAAGMIEVMGPDSTGVDLDRPDGDVLEFELQQDLVAIRGLVEEAIQILQSRIEGVNLSVKLDPNLKWRVEPLVFEGVLTSLIGHAADSVPDRDGIIVIRSREESEGMRYLEISFNGPADELLAVFGERPGRLVDSAGKLLVRPGLVAARETIQTRDGMIGVERLKGWGTCIWFTLEPVKCGLRS